VLSSLVGDVKLVEWANEIEGFGKYERAYCEIKNIYLENYDFRESVRETTRSVLEGKLKDGVGMERAIDEGVHYLLKELAFLAAASEMFDREKIAYVYHDRWGIYEDFVAGKFDGVVRRDLGFVVVR